MAITKTDVGKVKKALANENLPTDLAELARQVKVEGKDPAALGAEIDACAKGAVDKTPAAPPGPVKVKKLPDGLVEATAQRAKKKDGSMHETIDRVVTSRPGFLALAKEYTSFSDVQAQRLIGRLAEGAGALDPGRSFSQREAAATYVGTRVQRLVHFLRCSAGAKRDALKKQLGKIHPAANPIAPVYADVTTYRQRSELVGSTIIRYIDVNPDCDERTILLIHGHGSSLEEYESLVPLLAKRARVIVPDLPGCGYSDKPDRKHTVGYLAKTLVGLLDDLAIDRSVMAGGSLGGNLTLRLGLDHALHASKLAAWAPAGWIGTDDLLAFGARVARNFGPWIFWLTYNEQKKSWYSDDWPGKKAALDGSDRLRNEIYSEAYHRAYFDIAAEQTGTTRVKRAKEISVPTLLMCGKHDDALDMYATVSGVLAKEIPDAVFKDKFDFGRHSLASEDTKKLAKYINDYVC